MLTKFEELETIRQEIERLEALKEEMIRPPLSDFDLLPLLYKWFNEIHDARDFAPRSESVMQRNKFLLIVLWLYSPLTLTGEKMRLGLREKLVETLHLRTPSSISNVCGDLLFYYRQYTSFRKDVDECYEMLWIRLQDYLEAG